MAGSLNYRVDYNICSIVVKLNQNLCKNNVYGLPAFTNNYSSYPLFVIDGQEDEVAVATRHEDNDMHGQQPAGMNHFPSNYGLAVA